MSNESHEQRPDPVQGHVQVTGQAMQAGRAQVRDARLELRDGGTHLYLIALDTGEQLFDCAPERCKLEPPLGSAPRRLLFPGGHLFLTQDPAIAAMLGERHDQHVIVRFERSLRWAAAAVLITVATGWMVWSLGLPHVARLAANATPTSWLTHMDLTSVGVLGFQVKIDDRAGSAQRALAKRTLGKLAAELEEPLELTLLFMDDPSPNAFALPGGTIIVTQGLLDEFGRDEGALAAVLGHEIAHVVERHGLQNLYSSSAIYLAAALVFGDVGPVIETLLVEGQALLNLVYSRDHERAADKIGLGISRQAGYDPEGLIRFLEGLRADLGGDAQPSWLSSHPGLDERIKLLRAELGGAPN